MAYSQQEKEQDAILDRLLRGPKDEYTTLALTSTGLVADTTVATQKKTKWAKQQEAYLASTANGFEDLFADVPLRPEEYVIEKEQYSTKKSPAMRMELCIQKYRVSRKLVNQGWRERVFNAYLVHGGIQTGQKDYGAGDVGNHDMTNEEIRTTRAIDFVDETIDREVDFVTLVRSFFSYRCTAAAGHLLECVKSAPDIIINFLKYINLHDVLPEYRSQINEAIEFADKAKVEIYATKLLSLQLPGELNRSLSTVCGGHFSGITASAHNWENGKIANTIESPTESPAWKYLLQVLPDFSMIPGRTPLRLSGLPVEVQSISKYNAALSSVILVPWAIPEIDHVQKVPSTVSELLLLVEHSIADMMYERLHLEADFYELKVNLDGRDITLYYFDSVTRVLPSYYIEIDDEDL